MAIVCKGDWHVPGVGDVCLCGDYLLLGTPNTRLLVEDHSWESLYKRLADIRRTKANDYTGGQPDDMANYRNAADFAEMPMEKLLLARMQEKMYRLKMLLNRTERQVMDETFTDTCVDIANLALLLGKEHNG